MRKQKYTGVVKLFSAKMSLYAKSLSKKLFSVVLKTCNRAAAADIRWQRIPSFRSVNFKRSLKFRGFCLRQAEEVFVAGVKAVDLIKLLKVVKKVRWRKSIETFANLQAFMVVSSTLQ